MLKLKFEKLFYIPILMFMIVPYFVLYLGDSVNIPYARVIAIIFLTAYAVFFNKPFLHNLKLLLSYRFSKYVCFFFIWQAVVLIILMLISKASFVLFLNIFTRITGSLFVLFITFVAVKNLSFTKTLKYLYILIYVVLFIGIFDFWVHLFHISIIENVFKIFINHMIWEKPFVATLPRIQGFYSEAGYYGYFIFLSLPFIYFISSCKIQLLENKLLDYYSKKILPYIAWGTLIGTQSPIFLVFSIIFSSVYIVIRKRISMKKLLYSIFVFTILCFIIAFFLTHVSIDGTYLERIQKTILGFGSIENLIDEEPSLATRIISYINMIFIFLNNPIFGCGAGLLPASFLNQLLNSPVTLSPELQAYFYMDKTTTNPSIFFATLAETGIIGVLLYFFAYIQLYNSIKKIMPYLNPLGKNLLFHFQIMIIVYIISSVYDSNIYNAFTWIYFGILLGIINKVKYNNIVTLTNEVHKNGNE